MTVSPKLLPPTEAEQEALDYIAANNGDGRYDALLARYAAGEISVGLLAFKGEGLATLRREQSRLRALLETEAPDRLDVDIEAVAKAHSQITQDIHRGEAAVANPVVYAVRKAAA